MSRSNALTPTQEAVVRFLAQGLPAAAAAAQAGVHRSTVYHWQRTNPLFATRLNESRHEVATHFLEQFHARADKALTTIDRLLDDPSTPAAVQARLALAILNAAATPLEPARILAHALDHTINAPMPGEDEVSRYQSSALARSAGDPAYQFGPEPEYEPDSQDFPDEEGEQSAKLRQNPTTVSSNEAHFINCGNERKAPLPAFPPSAHHPAAVDPASSCMGTSILAPAPGTRQFSTNPTMLPSNEVGSAPHGEHQAPCAADEIAGTAANGQPAAAKPQPYRRAEPKTGRNEICPCGSGQKYKRCCLVAAQQTSLTPHTRTAQAMG